MQYVEAPYYENTAYPSVFLAGGITNCPDWQLEIVEAIRQSSLDEITIFNPRRKDFPIGDPAAAEQQITWEYKRLRQADMIVFWFSVGSLNPIVLFEFGAAMERGQKLLVGCHPEYERRADVKIQAVLRRPNLVIADSLQEMTSFIINNVEKQLKLENDS